MDSKQIFLKNQVDALIDRIINAPYDALIPFSETDGTSKADSAILSDFRYNLKRGISA